MEPKPKRKTPQDSKEKFLEFANQLENGEIKGMEPDKEGVELVITILRGEDRPNLE